MMSWGQARACKIFELMPCHRFNWSKSWTPNYDRSTCVDRLGFIKHSGKPGSRCGSAGAGGSRSCRGRRAGARRRRSHAAAAQTWPSRPKWTPSGPRGAWTASRALPAPAAPPSSAPLAATPPAPDAQQADRIRHDFILANSHGTSGRNCCIRYSMLCRMRIGKDL